MMCSTHVLVVESGWYSYSLMTRNMTMPCIYIINACNYQIVDLKKPLCHPTVVLVGCDRHGMNLVFVLVLLE